jgi:hypothetical protein
MGANGMIPALLHDINKSIQGGKHGTKCLCKQPKNKNGRCIVTLFQILKKKKKKRNTLQNTSTNRTNSCDASAKKHVVLDMIS